MPAIKFINYENSNIPIFSYYIYFLRFLAAQPLLSRSLFYSPKGLYLQPFNTRIKVNTRARLDRRLRLRSSSFHDSLTPTCPLWTSVLDLVSPYPALPSSSSWQKLDPSVSEVGQRRHSSWWTIITLLRVFLFISSVIQWEMSEWIDLIN